MDSLAIHLLMLEQVYQLAKQLDIIHFHCDYLHFPVTRRQNYVHVTTLHGRLDLRELGPLYREFSGMPVISISDSQRQPLPWANWQGTVYHGLPEDLHTFREKPGNYLAFLGRVSPEKGVDQAIEIARRAGMPLKIAAKVDIADQDFYRKQIEPLLKKSKGFVEFIGKVGGAREGRVSRERLCVAVSDQLAGALWLGHDRSDGLRHTGHRLPARLGTGDHGGWRHRVCGRAIGRGGQRCGAGGDAEPEKVPAGVRRTAVSRTTRMARDYLQIYRRLIEDKAAKRRDGRAIGSLHSRRHANGQPKRVDPDWLGVWPD